MALVYNLCAVNKVISFKQPPLNLLSCNICQVQTLCVQLDCDLNLNERARLASVSKEFPCVSCSLCGAYSVVMMPRCCVSAFCIIVITNDAP